MKPQHQQSQEDTTYTSPWTEAYQSSPSWSEDAASNGNYTEDARETQEPTWRALSDCYNNF